MELYLITGKGSKFHPKWFLFDFIAKSSLIKNVTPTYLNIKSHSLSFKVTLTIYSKFSMTPIYLIDIFLTMSIKVPVNLTIWSDIGYFKGLTIL